MKSTKHFEVTIEGKTKKELERKEYNLILSLVDAGMTSREILVDAIAEKKEGREKR